MAMEANANEPVKKEQIKFIDIVTRLRTFIALFAVLIVFSIIAPNYLSGENLLLMAKHVTIMAIIAIGQTFVILTAGIDLSVGSLVGLTGMAAGFFINRGITIHALNITIYFRVGVIIVIVLLLGTAVGYVNGFFITKFNVAPFIATLGMMYIARGFALLASGGQTFPNLDTYPKLGVIAVNHPDATKLHGLNILPNFGRSTQQIASTHYQIIGQGNFLGVPIMVWILIIFGIVATYVTTKMPFGRYVYAVGGNENAAKVSGVRVNRTKLFVYMISGFCAAMVGIMTSSQLVAAHPATGTMYELNSIAATTLGGTSLFGGRGTIWGSIVGAFVIGTLIDGLVMVGVSTFWQKVVIGVVIIFAVTIDNLQVKIQEKRSQF